MPVQQLKRFDELYGWVIRWALILLLAGIVFFADGRYLTREEVEKKELELHRIRTEDINMLNARIDAHRIETRRASEVSQQVLERLSSIEAQNAIIMTQITRLQDSMENHINGHP